MDIDMSTLNRKHSKTKPSLRDKQTSSMLTFSNPYITAATSNNTRLAYQADIRHFEKWGGILPTTPEMVINYLHAYASKLNSRTLARRLTAIKNWHIYQGFSDPTFHPSVAKTLTGITRTHGKPKEKAPPLLPEELLKIVLYLKDENSLHAIRDNALLQLAYFGAFRRSEIVAICYEQIEWKNKGIDILIPHSKADQSHKGQYCAIPYGHTPLCPVKSLENWLTISKIKNGPLFRRILVNDQLESRPLIPLSVNHILKKRAKQANLSQADNFSSHSLRRGLATAASRDGASLQAIMRQGRWKNINTVLEYIEAAQRFEENAATKVLNKIRQE